jgi:hypothetical protein
VAPLTTREVRWTFPAWWLDGRGIAVGTPVGALFAGRNKLMWQLFPNDPFRFSSARLDGPAPPAELFLTGFGPSGLVFPVAGCWRLRAEAPGDRTLEAIVYVYPWGCRPQGMQGDPPPSPEPCDPPQPSP